MELRSSPMRKERANGRVAREKILLASLRLFVNKGYAGTSMRDIAGAAEVNLAAIGYHFGDKTGLYRAAMFDILKNVVKEDEPPHFANPDLPFDEALRQYISSYLQPLEMGEAALLSVRLRTREYLEPTGLLESLAAERDHAFGHLVDILIRHFQLDTPDAELLALAVSIFALVSYPYVGRDHLASVQSVFLDAPVAVNSWEQRFVTYAAAMVTAETTRRNTAAGTG